MAFEYSYHRRKIPSCAATVHSGSHKSIHVKRFRERRWSKQLGNRKVSTKSSSLPWRKKRRNQLTQLRASVVCLARARICSTELVKCNVLSYVSDICKHRELKLKNEVFWRNFEVFGNVFKHKCECLIQLLKQIRTSGENEGEILAKLCKCWITFLRPVTFVIFLCLIFVKTFTSITIEFLLLLLSLAQKSGSHF